MSVAAVAWVAIRMRPETAAKYKSVGASSHDIDWEDDPVLESLSANRDECTGRAEELLGGTVGETFFVRPCRVILKE